jgi:hypothetical protein
MGEVTFTTLGALKWKNISEPGTHPDALVAYAKIVLAERQRYIHVWRRRDNSYDVDVYDKDDEWSVTTSIDIVEATCLIHHILQVYRER